MHQSISQQMVPDTASWLNKADDFARPQPTKAVLSASSVGFILNLLPISAIVGALAAAAFALARPVSLFLGLLKAVEPLRGKSTNQT